MIFFDEPISERIPEFKICKKEMIIELWNEQKVELTKERLNECTNL